MAWPIPSGNLFQTYRPHRADAIKSIVVAGSQVGLQSHFGLLLEGIQAAADSLARGLPNKYA